MLELNISKSLGLQGAFPRLPRIEYIEKLKVTPSLPRMDQ